MKIQIVLLSGKQGSGKTTIANQLVEQMDSNSTLVEHITFADPLREMHDAVLKILAKYGVKREIKKDGPLLQLLGTEWARNTIDQNIWVNMAKSYVDSYAKSPELESCGIKRLVFIISDCRFKNEFYAFPEALRVRLDCNKELRRQRCEMWRDKDDHISETDLDEYLAKFDMVLNTGLDTNPKHAATLMEAQLMKDSWLEKREIHTPDFRIMGTI